MKRTAEFVLSLIGVILGTLGWFWLPVSALIYLAIPDFTSFGSFIYFLIYAIIDIPVLVFNWIGTFKLKKHPAGWGFYFLVTGILFLNVFSIIVAGMLLGRQQAAEVSTPSAPLNNTLPNGQA